MACSSVGSDPGVDGADSVYQYWRALSDAPEIQLRMISQASIAKPRYEVRSHAPIGSTATKIAVDSLNFFYGKTQALKEITIDIPEHQVMAFIGPSGCGKTTFLRTLNRMNDVIPGTRLEGNVILDGQNIYASGADVVELRRKVGMVFQKSNPFPKSIFDNVAYGLKINRLTSSKTELEDRVEEALTDAALWSEVKDRLKSSALGLSGGQQ